jgi:hypothetical protein
MDSWRVQVNQIDKSETVNVSTPIIGYTVIKSGKGPIAPFYIDRGQTQQILDIFGYPNSTYPGIQDVIDFNYKTGLWVVAPVGTGAKYGGVFVHPDGTIPFQNGTTTKTIASMAAVANIATVGTGDGTDVTFTYTVPLNEYYNLDSLDILVDGVSISPTLVYAAGVETITATALTSGSFTIASGVLVLTFASAVADGDVITITYTTDMSDSYFVLFNACPQVDDIAVKVVADDANAGFFDIYVYRYDPVEQSYLEVTNSPYYVSIDPQGKDGYGRNVYVQNVFPSDNIILNATDYSTAWSTFVDDTAMVSLAGGARGTAAASADFVDGFEFLQDTNKYGVPITFDTTADSGVLTYFDTCRTTYAKRTRFLAPTADLSPTALIASSPVLALNNKGLYVYCLTWGIHKDTFSGTNFNCSNMGLIAGKMADVLLYGPGGSPTWIDENNIGGQLGSSIVSLNQTATETQLEQLDTLRLNPVVFDTTYGPMIVSDRTTYKRQSDYSYIGQSSLADYIINLVLREVIPYQISKLNDDFHRITVANKTNSILATVSSWLEDFIVICDRTNNTAEMMNQQKFVLTVGVQFTPYSQMIIFNFINSPTGTDIKESVRGS